MMGPVARVFITRAFPFEALERLQAEHEVDVWDDNAPPPRDALLERAAQADALLTIITERVDAELFDAAPSVKAVANLAVGTDNIDLEEAARARDPGRQHARRADRRHRRHRVRAAARHRAPASTRASARSAPASGSRGTRRT